MPDKSRTDLLREIRSLSDRLEEQDRRLARSKKLTTTRPRPQGKTGRAVPRGGKSAELWEWFAGAIKSLDLSAKILIELDAAGRVHAISGDPSDALGVSVGELIGTFWEARIADEDRERWRDYFANLVKAYSEISLSFRLRTGRRCAKLEAIAFRPPLPEQTIWIVLNERTKGHPPTTPEAVAKHWAGIFAHELNQPLASVLSTAQACRGLMDSGPAAADDMSQGMDGLIRRIHHATDVVRRLRHLAGGEPPRRAAADLAEVVRAALDVLQGPIEASRTAVMVDIPPDFPPVKIDAVQIVQVIVNLARNAVEAMSNVPIPRRQLTVRARFDSREAIVTVEDRGVGLSVDVIRRLFRPLASPKPTGMGLGLALCRQIVEAHGGRIWVKGNVPNGCLFLFSFPLEAEEA